MKILRWVGIVVGAAVAFAIVLLAAAPTVVSTSWGKKTCLGFASRVYPGTIELASLRAGWLSGVELQGLLVKDAKGRQVLSCSRFALKKPLLSLLVSQKDFGSIAIDSPAFFCYNDAAAPSPASHDSSKKTSGKAALQKSDPQRLPKTPDVRAKIDISGAQLVAIDGEKTVGQLNNGTVALDLDSLHTSKGKVEGDLALKDTTPTPLSLSFSLNGAPELTQMKGSFSFSCHGVPTELLAALTNSVDPQIGAFLKEAFGEKLSYSVSADLNGPNVVLHSVLDSGNLRSDVNVQVQDSVATVNQGPLLTGTISPRLFNLIANQPSITLLSSAVCSIENMQPLSIQIDQLRLTAPMDVRCSTKTPLTLSFGESKPTTTVAVESSLRGNSDVLDASVSVHAVTKETSANLTCTGSVHPKEDGYHIYAKTVLDGQWPAVLENAVGFPASSIGKELSSEAVLNDLVIKKDFSTVLSSPATIKVSLAPTSLPNGLQLSHPIDLSVTVLPFSLSKKDSVIKAVLQSGEVSFTDPKAKGPFTLSVPISFDVSQNKIKAEPTINNGMTPIVTGNTTIHLPKDSNLSPTIDSAFDVHKFPTSILEALFCQSLTSLVGESISSSVSCTFNGLAAKGNTLSFTGSGSFWKAQAHCALDTMKLSGTKPLEFEGTFSPAWFNALKKSDVSIAQPITVRFSAPTFFADLSSFLAPTGSQSPWELLETVAASANLSVSSIELVQQSATIGRLSPLLANFDVSGKRHAVDFSVSAPAGAADSMVVAAKGSCEGFWNKQGLTLAASHLRSTVNVDQFPTRALDIVAPGKGKLFEEAIGTTIHLTGNVSIDELKSGTATFDLSSKNCSAHLDGSIQNGTMTLKTPATASITVTKDAGEALFKDVSPLLATAVRSEKPIQVTVDSKGTAIPLSPFSLAKVEIPKITADVGKITVKNGGVLKVILALLGMGNAANGDDLDVWLTPLYLKFQKGVLTCARADALVASKLHMITWGDIDVSRDRINMIVAIPEESLASLRLKIMTPTPERGLQIPITGSSSHPDIDTKRATARLAGAGIMNNVPDKRLQILGGLIQAAATAAGEPDQPIPPPTTSPLPWESSRAS